MGNDMQEFWTINSITGKNKATRVGMIPTGWEAGIPPEVKPASIVAGQFEFGVGVGHRKGWILI